MANLQDIVKKISVAERNDVHVEITVTTECNCRCEYCFECSHDNTSRRDEELRQLELLKKTCEEFDITKYGRFHITFWGGEPMMNTKFLYEIIETTYKYEFVDYMMYSNGTLINNYRDFLSQEFIDSVKSRFHIQLSYDGEPHNTLMRHNSNENILKVADMLHNNGFRISFKATLSFKMLNCLPQVWDSYAELQKKYPHITYSPTLDQTSEYMTDESFETWKRVLVEVAKKEKKFIKKNGRPLWSWFDADGRGVCSLNNGVFVDTDGSMYVCHACPHTKNKDKFKLGDTSKISNFVECLNSGIKDTKIPVECQNCPSIICHTCNITMLDNCGPEICEKYKEYWNNVSVNNKDRCRYYKYFSVVYHALRLKL